MDQLIISISNYTEIMRESNITPDYGNNYLQLRTHMSKL